MATLASALPSLAEQTARSRLQAAGGPTIDLFQVADDIVTLLQAGAVADAATALDSARRGRSQVVQDALDRLVGARANRCYAPPGGATPAVVATLLRMSLAWSLTPRLPDATQMAALTEQGRHDVYASIIEAKGSAAAKLAARNGHRVILGLRIGQSTFVNNGTGDYNDSIVVLRAERQNRTAAEFLRANTEPTAQYDQNQRRRPGVRPRDPDGVDITRDGILELGRMATGTFEMLATTHDRPGGGTDWALRPTPVAVQNGAGMIQRDSNHDGLFDESDPNGRQPLNNSFKIHPGSRRNTDSAGCQTIHRDDYPAFVRAARSDAQTVWQYVLVEVTP